MNDVMIDLETLDLRPSSAILSIGAVRFDIHQPGHIGYRLETHISIQSNMDFGRTISADTLAWWMQQTDAAKLDAFANDARNAALDRVLMKLNTFLAVEDRVWGNGAAFDNAILADAYRSCKIKPTWSYKNDMCYRTMANLFPDVEKPTFKGVKHKAIDDAINQAHHLQLIYAKMKEPYVE